MGGRNDTTITSIEHINRVKESFNMLRKYQRTMEKIYPPYRWKYVTL
jgi:hypothetical protein